MPSRIDWYLVELDRHLEDFSEERREILLTEVESHLREQTDEMVAAGMNLAEADREAVRVFGQPAQFAERLRDETPPVSARESEASLKGSANGVVGLAAGLILFVMGVALLGDDRSGLFMLWLIVCVAIVLGSAITSRRVSLASILAGIVLGGAATATTLGLAFVDFGELDGMRIEPINVAQRRVHDVGSIYSNRLGDGRTINDAQRALEVPVPRRIVGFAGSGYLAAICGAGAMFAVWLWRHAARLTRLAKQAIRRRAQGLWTGVR